MIGHHDERFHRNAHRPMRCAQDVDSVDLYMIDKADSPADFGVVGKIDIDLFAQFRCELFGVIQTPMAEFIWENHGSRDNRTRQRAAASLIDSGDPNDAGGAELFFMSKTTAPVHAVRMLR
jgi:hypothetical protein